MIFINFMSITFIVKVKKQKSRKLQSASFYAYKVLRVESAKKLT